jgi:hypothetical protein
MRNPPRLAMLAVIAPGMIALPFILPDRSFHSMLRLNLEKWGRLGTDHYRVALASSSLADPTRRMNVLRVELDWSWRPRTRAAPIALSRTSAI